VPPGRRQIIRHECGLTHRQGACRLLKSESQTNCLGASVVFRVFKMIKVFFKESSRRFAFEPSRAGRFDFSKLERLPQKFKTWVSQRFPTYPVPPERNDLSHVAEDMHRALLERQLVTTQVALAKACSDLVEARQQAQHFRFQSLHDSLTALPNSVSIHKCLENSLKEYAPIKAKLAVMFIDIDNFKEINDQHGHLVGDEVLQIVSARISHAVRSEDRVGRLGGDEFLCLIGNDNSQENAGKIAVQIRDAVRDPIQIGTIRLVIQVSIGIAFSPGDALLADDLIGRADAAMYRAKRLKIGYAFFDYQSDANHGLDSH
jgi:diguanylate cyclase (GGDEF)-like protein